MLARLGYEAKGEVGACDVVALGPEPEGGGERPLVVVELKRALSLQALVQAVDRFALTDSVYIAVPTGRGAGRGAHAPGLHRLCRRLGLGLIAVEGRGVATPLLDPVPPGRAPRRNPARAALVRREHARRLGDPQAGGATGRARKMTAYRQDALRCAAALRDAGEAAPVRAVRAASGVAEAGRILHRNVYGWFEPVARDRYALTERGRLDLAAMAKRADLAG